MSKKYYQKNKIELLLKQKEYALTHKKQIQERNKKYYAKNKQKLLERMKIYVLKNKEKISLYLKAYGKVYQQEHKKEVNLKTSKWMKKHREQINSYRIKKYKVDISYKLSTNLRSRVYIALNGNTKSNNTMKLVGCSIQKLKLHLEKQFTTGMTWQNYGKNGWEIDHRIPCAWWDLRKPEQQKICFHYGNLQPLWVHENRSKNNRIGVEYANK